MENKLNRIYSNKVDYVGYLIARNEVRKKLGTKLQLPAVAVMNFMLYKKGFGNTEEGLKKNRVYHNSIETYLEKIPADIVMATIKKLTSIGEIEKSDKGFLEISEHVCKYFYELTRIETFNTSETSETVENGETDERWSTLPSLRYLELGRVRNILRIKKVNEGDLADYNKCQDSFYYLIFVFMRRAIDSSRELDFKKDLKTIFVHFGLNPEWFESLYNHWIGVFQEKLQKDTGGGK